jgi:hypothetical protein
LCLSMTYYLGEEIYPVVVGACWTCVNYSTNTATYSWTCPAGSDTASFGVTCVTITAGTTYHTTVTF